MIKLGAKPTAPEVLSRQKISDALAFLESQLNEKGSLSSKDFKGRNYWGEVKKDLWEYQDRKCCFCERQRDPNRESDVDHYRPKLAQNNEPAPGHDGYWWLAYTWENLFFVCSKCNSAYKKNSFPLINKTARAFNKDDDLLQERPYLLDPEKDDPEQFIIYDYTSLKVPVPVSGANDYEGRGRKTIEVLGLNKRTELITGRAEKLINMQLCARAIIRMVESDKNFGDQLDKNIERLKSHINSKSQFAGFSRFYYKNQAGLDKYVSCG